MRWRRAPILLAFMTAITCLTILSAGAEARIFVIWDGIDGDATFDLFPKSIVAISAGESVSRAIPTGATADRADGELKFGDFRIIKRLDVASPLLRLEAVVGTPTPTVKIAFVTNGSPGAVFFQIVLSDVLISSISMAFDDSSGQMVPVEVISLNFTKIEWTLTNLESQGGTGIPITTRYDVINKTIF